MTGPKRGERNGTDVPHDTVGTLADDIEDLVVGADDKTR